MRANRSGFAVAALTASVCACAQQPVAIQSKFDPHEVAWSRGPGTSTVRAQGFMRTRGGEVRTCAGQPAFLVPLSSYSRETHELIKRTMLRVRVEGVDPSAAEFSRKTRCDAQGNFTFRNVPAGEWFARAVVTWEVPSRQYSMDRQGQAGRCFVGVCHNSAGRNGGGHTRPIMAPSAVCLFEQAILDHALAHPLPRPATGRPRAGPARCPGLGGRRTRRVAMATPYSFPANRRGRSREAVERNAPALTGWRRSRPLAHERSWFSLPCATT